MPKQVTIQDVAREAGTSVSTVSRVLTGSARVSKAKRVAVEEAIARLGFRPSHVARSLRTHATFSVGLLVNDITNPFFSALARGAEEEAIRRGYSMMLCNTDNDPDRELQYLRMVRDKRVDGIIFGPTGANGAQIAQIVGSIPLVMIDRRIDEVPAAAVVADNEGGAYRAACALIQRGYHRLGIVAWLPPMETLAHRVTGIHRALSGHDIPIESAPIIRVSRIEPKEVRRVVREWLTERLEAGDAPSALFALNNQLGLGTLRALRDLGLKIPDEMGLMVFDDLEFFEVTLPPISAVAMPARQMGQRAMRHLLDRLEKPGEHLHEVTVLPTEVRIRQSI